MAPTLPAGTRVETLDNGLTVCLLPNSQAPIITSALWYRAGARDEAEAEAGVAHFLEHMMFKGSAAYGPGEIDRRTQALGGSNNAFTSYDATAYYFNFRGDRWQEALAIEADRMSGLNLVRREVDSERQVILEELAMYEDEPWDALEQAVQKALFQDHPYGRPIIGTRKTLRATDGEVLGRFHRHFYRPDNAVLVLAGDLPEDALEQVEERLGGIPGGAEPRPVLASPAPLDQWLRVQRRRGDVARFCLALRGPAAGDELFPAVRLLMSVLTSGRASRLHRLLVEERQSCLWVAGQVSESPLAGSLAVVLELVPGADRKAVEKEVVEQLARLATEPPTPKELERARRVLLADWVFGHERVHQQALSAGFALTLFDLDHPRRWLQRSLDADEDQLAAAARCFDPAGGGVVGWSLPARGGSSSPEEESFGDPVSVVDMP